MKKASYAVAIAITLASLYLSFRFMTHAGPMWRDEAATVQFATQPRYADVLASLDLVSLPLLYPTILRAWLSLDWSDQDAGVRMLGLVVFIAVLAAIWLGALALGTGPPLVLLAVFAMHGTVVATLGAARPYGLGTLAVLGASCAVLRLVDSPRATVFAVAAALTTLAVQIQYQNVLFVAAVIGAGLAAAAWRRNVRSMSLMFMSGVIAALSLIPYLGILERSQQWRILHHSMAEGGPAALARRFVDILAMDSAYLSGAWAIMAVLACFHVVRELRLAPRNSAPQSVFAALLLVTTIGALLGFFLFVERDLQPWHVVPLIVLLALALEVIFARADAPAALRLVIAVFVAILSLPASLPQVSLRQTNVDFIAQRLGRDAAPGDLIVANPWYLGITLERYFRGKTKVVTVPPVDDLKFHRIDQIRERMVSSAPLQPLEASLADTLRGGGRVWVVGALQLPGANVRLEPLPPAPHPVSGWSELAYTIGWSLQLGAFVRAHAQRVTREAVPLLKAVNDYENAQLFRIEGWVDLPGAK